MLGQLRKSDTQEHILANSNRDSSISRNWDCKARIPCDEVEYEILDCQC